MELDEIIIAVFIFLSCMASISAQEVDDCSLLKEQILSEYFHENLDSLHFDGKIDLFKNLERKADKMACVSEKTTSMVILGNLFKDNGYFKPARTYYNKALSIRIELKDTVGILSIYGNLISLENQSGFPSHGLEIYEHAQIYLKKLDTDADKFLQQQIRIILNAANCYRGIENYKESRSLYNKANKLSLNKNPIPFHGLGDIEVDLHNYDDAIQAYQRAKKIYEENSNFSSLALLSRSLALAYLGKNDSINTAYFMMQSAALAHKTSNNLLLSDAIISMIKEGIKPSSSEGVQTYLKKLTEETSLDFGSYEEKCELLEVISNMYSQNGHHEQAYYLQKKAASLLNHSLLDKVNRETELTAEIDKRIALGKKKNQISILIASLFLVTLIALFYIRAKELEKTQLEKDKRELELSHVNSRLNIEHELRGKLAIETHDIKTVVAAVRNNIDFAQTEYKTYSKLGELLHTTYDLAEQILSRIISVNKALNPDKTEWYKNLQNLLSSIESNGSLQTNINADLEFINEIDSEVGYKLFNSVSVLLDNVKEHAKGTQLNVDIKKISHHLSITVTDNGIGNFDPTKKEGLGLKSVRLRVEDELKGVVNFDTTNGTKVELLIPIISLNYGGEE